MSNKTLVQHPSIHVNGDPEPTVALDDLLDLRVESSIGLPAEAQFSFRDTNSLLANSDVFAVGKDLQIKVPMMNDLVTIFDGAVYSFAIEQVGATHELVVGALDKTIQLIQGTTVHAFIDQSARDIVAKIAASRGLEVKFDRSDGGLMKHSYLLQTETDRAFLDRLAFMEGMEWYLEGKTLHFTRRELANDFTFTLGVDLRTFDARFSHRGGATEVEVRGWDRRWQRSISSRAAVNGARVAKATGADFATHHHDKGAKNGGMHRLLASPHVVDTLEEGRALAGALADRLASEEIQVRGEVLGQPNLRIGQTVTIDGAGMRFNGSYFVSSVEHVFGQDLGFTTRFKAGGADPGGVTELVAGRPVPSFLSSLIVGIVTNNRDDQNLGRVKVKFPTLSDLQESNWARVLTIASGSSHGVLVLPEVGDEVLVGFEHGDSRHPVVVGGLYSEKNKPPLAYTESVKDNKVASWLLKSRTGNTLQFLDGTGVADATVLVRHANAENLLRVQNDRIELLGKAGTELSIKIGNASISITKNGDIVLDGANITLKARQDIKLQAGVGLEAKGNTSAKLLGGASSFEASAGGATVKGPMVQLQGTMVKVG